MLQTFSKYAGVIRTLLGLSGQFVPAIGSAIGTATGGNFGIHGSHAARHTEQCHQPCHCSMGTIRPICQEAPGPMV
jgi:hypothetical protein